jgi:hypothetical protein
LIANTHLIALNDSQGFTDDHEIKVKRPVAHVIDVVLDADAHFVECTGVSGLQGAASFNYRHTGLDPVSSAACRKMNGLNGRFATLDSVSGTE